MILRQRSACKPRGPFPLTKLHFLGMMPPNIIKSYFATCLKIPIGKQGGKHKTEGSKKIILYHVIKPTCSCIIMLNQLLAFSFVPRFVDE